MDPAGSLTGMERKKSSEGGSQLAPTPRPAQGTQTSACIWGRSNKHYFLQKPTFVLYLSNNRTTDFNKGDIEQCKAVF